MESNKKESMDKTAFQEDDLEKIRYFRANWKNFFDYWKRRGAEPK